MYEEDFVPSGVSMRSQWFREKRVDRFSCMMGFRQISRFSLERPDLGVHGGLKFIKSGAVARLWVHVTRRAALLRRVISEQWRNSARLGSKLFMANWVFEWLVLRILKFVLDEIKNNPRSLFEEYFVPSAVSRGNLGSEKSTKKDFCT